MTNRSTDPATTSRMRKVNQVECLATAIRFLTRIPVPGAKNHSQAQYAELLRESVIYFPFVGGLIGFFTATMMLASFSIGMSALLAALIALGLEAILTGALHEDGFADSCDGLGGAWSRERVLEIMKCSQLGTYGVVALVVGLGARAAAMAAISEGGATWTLASIVAAASLGRLAMVGLMVTTKPIPSGSLLTKDIAQTQDVRSLLLSLCLGAPFWAGWFAIGPAIAAASIAATLVMLFLFRRSILNRLNGTTGDLLGCSAFLSQLTLLIGASVI